MSSKIFLDQLLGSFQLFQPFSGDSKLLLVDLNQGLRLNNSCPSSGNDLLHTFGDDLGFLQIVNQPLVIDLEVVEMTSLFSHLLLHLFSLVFLSGESLLSINRASSIRLTFFRVFSSPRHIPSCSTSIRYALACSGHTRRKFPQKGPTQCRTSWRQKFVAPFDALILL